MRNVFKQAEQGRKRLSVTRDLSCGELNQIFDQYKSVQPNTDTFNLIHDIFCFGLEQGYRQAKADQKAKTK